MGLFDYFRKKDLNFQEGNEGTGVELPKFRNEKELLQAIEPKVRVRFRELLAGTEDPSIAINAAFSLMLDGQYLNALGAWALIAKGFPIRISTCHAQSGVCLHRLGYPHLALTHYKAAREKKEPPHLLDADIWECCNTLYLGTGDRKWIKSYLDLCPEGNFKAEAEAI